MLTMASSDSGSAAIGGILVILILAAIVGFAIFILTKVAPKVNGKRRDTQIETAMRLGVRDAQAQRRIAQKILDEQRQGP